MSAPEYEVACSSSEGKSQLLYKSRQLCTLAYNTVNPIAIGKFTQVFKKGMTSAPLPGAVTTSTSCVAAGLSVSGGAFEVFKQAAQPESDARNYLQIRQASPLYHEE